MKLEKITVKDFRRFSDLTIQGLPATARLLILCGPNGSGKSSFFDALNTWHGWTSRKSPSWSDDYHAKTGSRQQSGWQNQVQVEVQDQLPNPLKKALYVRSAYRNDPEFQISHLERQGDPLDQTAVARMINNDAAVSRNYTRLASRGLIDLWKGGQRTFDDYLSETIGDIHEPMSRLFPDLILESLGDPLEDGTFHFTKGHSNGFAFMNLSGGEKAAFDLILDLIVARRDYDETVYCIDEPESHLHSRLQATLLNVLFDLIPKNSQLILATHSIGMMRSASEIERDYPGQVVFLDFGGRDFDEPQVIEPAKTDRRFWKSIYRVALGDLSQLVAPNRVVICEGTPASVPPAKNQSFDALCYSTIFEEEFPETEFISMGNDREVIGDKRGLAEALQTLMTAVTVVPLVDRDNRSPEEVRELVDSGVRVLSRRNIECFLFDDEVLRELVAKHGLAPDPEPLLDVKESFVANLPDGGQENLKKVRGSLYNECKNWIVSDKHRNGVQQFMRLTLAPLIKPGMLVYEELKKDIFGS